MSKLLKLEAVVLKTHDVGEADRFCILYSKERGKIACRARSVRKLGSRLGGYLLPMRHLELEVREGSAGFLITHVETCTQECSESIESFMEAQQGIEILLSLLEDDEPSSDIFETLLMFLAACNRNAPHTVLPFTIRLLHLSGLLPETNAPYFANYTEIQKSYITLSASSAWETLPTLDQKEKDHFSHMCATLLSHMSTRQLKAGSVMNALKHSAASQDAA